MNRKALVTVAIGDYTIDYWNRWFRPTWERYAERHGYDIVVIRDYVDGNPHNRTANWQKLKIFDHPDAAPYEDVVWLDADILINYHSAPCVVDHHSSDLVGLVSDKEAYFSVASVTDNLRRRLQTENGWDRIFTPREVYQRAGMEEVDDYANTGVMVLKRSRHHALFNEIYETYGEHPTSAKEEAPTVWHLFRNGLVKPIDPRFNRIYLWVLTEHYPALKQGRLRTSGNPAHDAMLKMAATTGWLNAWFLHFTADRVKDPDGPYSSREDVRYVLTDCPDALDLRFGRYLDL